MPGWMQDEIVAGVRRVDHVAPPPSAGSLARSPRAVSAHGRVRALSPAARPGSLSGSPLALQLVTAYQLAPPGTPPQPQQKPSSARGRRNKSWRLADHATEELWFPPVPVGAEFPEIEGD